MDQSSEFVLLEKVVEKLASIANISTAKTDIEVKEVMDEEDIMKLNWMQGQQVTAPVAVRGLSRRDLPEGEASGTPREDRNFMSALHSIPVEVTDSLDTWHFNSLDINKEMKVALSAYLVVNYRGSAAWVQSNIQETQLFKFCTVVETKYVAKNPFHNFSHALDVTYTVSRYMKLIEAERFQSEVGQFWLLIAAIAHDVGHPGVNNPYLIDTSHEIAIKYNDRSPLENFHCAQLFLIASTPECNIFSQVEKDLYKEMRKGIIEAILHTDVTFHNDMVKELNLLYQYHSEKFDAGEPTFAVCEVLQSSGNPQLVANAILHGADVGNPMKPWELCKRIAFSCLEEFFAQGDQERAAGIPVQMLNDREKVNRPNSQVGFIEFVICPMVEAMVSMFPTLDALADNLGKNIGNWVDTWKEENDPAPEALSKVQARSQKVQARCQALLRSERTFVQIAS
eukprot:gnl/TRDRNA2_/TRDRNA2_67271_c1_seq1.p1 gnl/TRDRNA2_/TRDRNA2_67271_c1~~gnl/TRDRNA2_/TRDRNA2_67271_c1_seq1.p1  ORF type:complete len:492 (+),score=113.52 gnl/TRDRNA2_/TRDRNA2_67271_c1_seq1:119-1477(+)